MRSQIEHKICDLCPAQLTRLAVGPRRDSARSRCELPANRPLRGCVGRTALKSSPHSARKTKGPRGGGFGFSGGERGIQLARDASSLPTGRCAAALVEQRSNPHLTRQEKQKAPGGGLWFFWRRERDSNPRRGISPYSLSRGALSTTQPSLRITVFYLKAVLPAKYPSGERVDSRLKPLALRAHCVRPKPLTAVLSTTQPSLRITVFYLKAVLPAKHPAGERIGTRRRGLSPRPMRQRHDRVPLATGAAYYCPKCLR